MSVDSNVTMPEAEKKLPETEVKTEAPKAETAAPSAEAQNEINWKKFREQREKERKERVALEEETRKKSEEINALRQAVESLVSKPAPVVQPDGMGYELTDEERIKQQVKAEVDAVLAARDRESEKQRAEREAREMPQKLVSTFSDFNEVCTTENLDYLEYHYPEIADSFKNQSESFQKWANIYKAVKRFIPNAKTGNEAKIAQRNMEKPQSMAVKGLTPHSDTAPVKLDDQRRADNWSRMQRIMKGIA